MTRTARNVEKSAKTVSAMIVILGASILVLAAAIVWAEIRTEQVWDPLGDYPTQHVTSTVRGVEGPAVRLGETVNVEAIKCNDTSREVDVETSLSWRSVEPRGAAWHRGPSLSTRDPGCEALTFSNVIPDPVVALIEAQHAAGFPAPVWRIVGSETPIRDDGPDGQRQTWSTENFRVLP